MHQHCDRDGGALRRCNRPQEKVIRNNDIWALAL
jgi:hypothetical protein